VAGKTASEWLANGQVAGGLGVDILVFSREFNHERGLVRRMLAEADICATAESLNFLVVGTVDQEAFVRWACGWAFS
jgi:hypothetical protein